MERQKIKTKKILIYTELPPNLDIFAFHGVGTVVALYFTVTTGYSSLVE